MKLFAFLLVYFYRVNVSLCESNPLGLFQLLVELIEGLTVLLPQLCQLLLVDLGFVFQSLLQLGHLGFTFGPGGTMRKSAVA